MTDIMLVTPKEIPLLLNATSTATSKWCTPPAEKSIEVEGISGDTVLIEYKMRKNGTVKTLQEFTADGDKACSDYLPYVRARISNYSGGNITVTLAYSYA